MPTINPNDELINRSQSEGGFRNEWKVKNEQEALDKAIGRSMLTNRMIHIFYHTKEDYYIIHSHGVQGIDTIPFAVFHKGVLQSMCQIKKESKKDE